jgi:phosphate:Na+ symporter
LSPGTAVIVNLLGGIALLLWGVRMVRTGIMRAWGDQLKAFLETRLGGRLSAFLSGAAATAVLGSATAMTLIVAGIAASGAIGGVTGLAVLLGADAGSAVVSAIFASGSALALWLSPVFLFAGYIVFSASREFRPHNIGRMLIGLGLMLLSLQLIKSASIPLQEASLFHQLLEAVGREPLLAFLCGAAMAWLFHSTLAAILLIASFLGSGSLSAADSLAFILGINFGGGLPAFTATMTLSVEARRLPLANLVCRAAASVLALAFLPRIAPAIDFIPGGAIEKAAGFHALFNVTLGLVFLPFVRPAAGFAARLLPNESRDDERATTPRYLDMAALSTPAVALANALFETVRMSEILNRMFDTALEALRGGGTEKLKQLKLLDERLNAFHVSVQSYLAELSQAELSAAESRRALEIILYVSNLEHAGDVLRLNLSDRIKTKAKEGVVFTAEEQASLDDLCLIIHDSIRIATGVLSSGDLEGARRLIAQKDAFRMLENRVLDDHFRRGGAAKGKSLRRSALYVDMIRDLHRINSHIVSAAYPIADAAGLLRGSRLVGGPEENGDAS